VVVLNRTRSSPVDLRSKGKEMVCVVDKVTYQPFAEKLHQKTGKFSLENFKMVKQQVSVPHGSIQRQPHNSSSNSASVPGMTQHKLQ